MGEIVGTVGLLGAQYRSNYYQYLFIAGESVSYMSRSMYTVININN